MDRVPLVGIIMGSASDWETLEHAAKTLETLTIHFEKRVISAHRTPDLVATYAASARSRGIKVIIAGAGGAAHLPGMTAASADHIPVIGVPIPSTKLQGMDALLSIVQMPKGVPVNTMSIGEAGAVNAALSAAEILALTDATILASLRTYREQLRAKVEESDRRMQDV